MPDCQLPKFGRITVDPDVELNGVGQNIDSIEFWKAPDSTQTLMFVTAKDNHLVEVWKYPFIGNEQTQLTNSTFSNSQVNGIAIDQDTDLLFISIGSPSSTISVFSLPDLTFVKNFNRNGADYKSEPNLTILKLSNGSKNIYVSMDYTVDIHNEETGEFISTFTPEKGLETLAADYYYQRIYIPDENNRTGVYVYNPDGGPYTDNGSNNFGNDVFDADAEGIVGLDGSLDLPLTLHLSPVLADKLKSRASFAKYLSDEQGATTLHLKMAGSLKSPRPTLDMKGVQEQLQKSLEKEIFKKLDSSGKDSGQKTSPENIIKGLFGK